MKENLFPLTQKNASAAKYANTLAHSLKRKRSTHLNHASELSELTKLANMAVTCRLCEDPACIAACPRDALTQSKKQATLYLTKTNATAAAGASKPATTEP